VTVLMEYSLADCLWYTSGRIHRRGSGTASCLQMRIAVGFLTSRFKNCKNKMEASRSLPLPIRGLRRCD